MPDVLIRNVDDTTLTRLKQRAKENGHSLQNDLLLACRSLVEQDALSDEKTAARIKKSLRGGQFSDSAVQLRKDRSR